MSSIIDNFNCYSCGEVPETPFESECCGKLYCQACSENSSYLSCRHCRSILKFKISIFAKNLMSQIETNCKFECEVKFKISESKAHNLQCKSKIFKCTINKCSFLGQRENLVNHVLEVHYKELLVVLENYSEFNSVFSKYIVNTSKTSKDNSTGSKNQLANTKVSVSNNPVNKFNSDLFGNNNYFNNNSNNPSIININQNNINQNNINHKNNNNFIGSTRTHSKQRRELLDKFTTLQSRFILNKKSPFNNNNTNFNNNNTNYKYNDLCDSLDLYRDRNKKHHEGENAVNYYGSPDKIGDVPDDPYENRFRKKKNLENWKTQENNHYNGKIVSFKDKNSKYGKYKLSIYI